ncbi:hypothetical protein SAMN04515620_11839 [Collimonas sp. OK607]|uniref:hypothetical protein n=1 Tax=Collimonas sp. OK607 TaxID=1798194 RepID=UPI0008E71DE3|nr:hypothetical protein [Collimonas sp. OK607]SFB10794.1 hypothetical protein SAMN04515620_11839 [Collimonas sp. OK607]
MHPAIRIFGAFFLAIALASGVLYAIDHSLNTGSSKNPERQAKTAGAAPFATNPAPSTPVAATLAAGAPPPPASSTTSTTSNRPLLENVGVIAKCTIDGKIVYTDKGCPQGSKAKPVQITDNAIIPGVDQATIERTLRQPPPQLTQAAPSAAIIEPAIGTITTEAGVDCLALGRRVEWLNAMGHRRQPPHIRDRMQHERDDLQTRRFWAHC